MNDSRGSDGALATVPAVGDTIGPYRLLRELGEGTAGKVFEVEHLRIGRHAAMKIVHPESAVPGIVRRLFVEAQAVNLIGNPHIVEITDVIETHDGRPLHALVMELLEGAALADLLAKQEPLPVARLLPIMAQVCDALAAVHAAGFVHRDLKPENVFLVRHETATDFVKLLDFGLVKAMRPDMASPKATVQGTFLGSPAYASPEQAAGKPVDVRTDIYAVGVMLYELVTGRLPFEAETVGEVLIKQINQPAPRLGDALLATELGQALDAIIQACLAKDPAERGLTAPQLAGMFRQLASGAAGAPKEICRSHGLRVRARRSKPLRAVVGVAVIGAVALLLGNHTASQLTHTAPPAAAAAMAAPPSSRPVVTTAAAAACPAVTKVELPDGAASRRMARASGRIGRAMTLDPYR